MLVGSSETPGEFSTPHGLHVSVTPERTVIKFSQYSSTVLAYHDTGQSLIFSENPALVPQPRQFLEWGHTLVYRDRNITITEDDPLTGAELHSQIKDLSFVGSAQLIKSMLQKVVASQVDEFSGFTMSGGTDTFLIAATFAALGLKNAHAFMLRHSKDRPEDSQYGAEHHKLLGFDPDKLHIIEIDKVPDEILDLQARTIASMMEKPNWVRWRGSIGMRLVALEAAKYGVNKLFTGDDGDTYFAKGHLTNATMVPFAKKFGVTDPNLLSPMLLERMYKRYLFAYPDKFEVLSDTSFTTRAFFNTGVTPVYALRHPEFLEMMLRIKPEYRLADGTAIDCRAGAKKALFRFLMRQYPGAHWDAPKMYLENHLGSFDDKMKQLFRDYVKAR
jgi:asparagine synthetase B (glutamine-hydrolysing)